jgi:endo-1,4-beta-xylanase
LFFFSFVLVFCFISCRNPDGDETKEGNKDIAVTFQTLTANGSASAQSNALTLTFDKDIENLAAGDITLTAGTTGAVKDALTRSAAGIYSLAITGVTTQGDVSVSVAKTGYEVSGNPKTATVYPAPSTGLQDIAVTFNSLTADGSASAQTTALRLTFSQDITDLAASDITLDAGATGAVKGVLTRIVNSSANPWIYSLAVTGVTTQGDVSVSVAKTGYEVSGNPKTATVYPAPVAVTFNSLNANGSASAQTTALVLMFGQDINLAVGDITLDAGTTGAVKGALTRMDYVSAYPAAYRLDVTGVTTQGIVSVSVAKTGYVISGNPKTVVVYPAPPSTPDFVTVTTWSGLTVPSGTAAVQYNIAQHGKTNVLKVSPGGAKYGYSVLEYSLNEYKDKEVTINISFDIWLETAGKAAWQLGQDGYPLVCGSFSETLQTGQWHTVTGSATVTPNGTLYLSSQQLGDTVTAYLANFVITVDGVTITPPVQIDPNAVLHTKWPFLVGAAAPTSAFTTTNGQYPLLKHFNVLVAENDMKPQSIMPYNKPTTFPGTYNWTNADKLVNYAKANDTKVRGHVLVWHSQTPDYFFDVTGSGDTATTTMTKETLYDRMEKHIETVFKKYKGDVGWWDVCNEVVGDDAQGQIRKAGNPSNGGSWYTKVMENSEQTGMAKYEFVLKAFQFARKYADANGGTNVKLYLTDYNIEFYTWGKHQEFLKLLDYLRENDAPIDGVGFQTHINYTCDVNNLSQAIDNVAAKTRKDGVKLMTQVTELDMSLFDDSSTVTLTDAKRDERLAIQAQKYRDLFDMFKQKYEAGKLDMALLWGVNDGNSWLNNRPQGRVDHPLLFDRQYQPKAAFNKLVE